ncbi:hypothetical protein ABZP36_009385 [Zizania latifolia]
MRLAAEFLLVAGAVATLALACVPEERDALLEFKDGITGDPGGRLATWRRAGGHHGGDCCRWRGVRCSNRTGHVVALWLRNAAAATAGPEAELDDRGYYAGAAALVGRISPSLLSLRRLRHLDLSRNYLEGSPPGPPPPFLGGLSSLRYLNLSGIFFSGEVPPQLGNLSMLQYLDLSTDFDAQLLRSSDLSWLARLPLLQHLSLSSVDLSRAYDWPQAVTMLPSLRTLRLSSCSLPSSGAHQWRLPPRHNLTNLKELDLSTNNFNQAAASCWFWNITSLTDLNLMGTRLRGQLPAELDGMASLQVLDFSYNGNKATMARSLKSLCNLRILDLDSSLAGGDIAELLESLPQQCSSNRLEELYLPNNGMTGTLPDYSKLMHLTGLRILDLSYNNLTGSIPQSIGNLAGLDTLDLSFNKFSGSVPAGKGYFAGLSTLVLSENSLSGQIPAEIRYFSSLTTLDLFGNNLSGPVPSEIGMLANLTYLGISSNDLDGVITEEHLSSLARLTTIDLSLNPLKIELGSEWKPPFRLDKANFSHCSMGPLFPAWLQWQKALSCLDISNTGINDRLPDWLSTAFPNMAILDISENSIYGGLPVNLEAMSMQELYLSSNQLTGHIPKLPRNITILDFSMNSLSGPLPKIRSPKLLSLILFSNHITGHIPESICESQDLFILDLANNLLVGGLPRCDSMETMRYLLLSNNSLSGKFPPFVQSCTNLGFLDLGWNRFSGTLPMWIEDLVQLQFLRLSYNMFSGNIPTVFTKLKCLHHLNLAGNNISGTIPQSLSNLTSMTQMKARVNSFPYQGYASVVGEPGNSLSVVTKGQELNYGVGILDVVSIDLSLNDLTGVIPEEIISLDALLNLNLSWNHLSGKIPDKIGIIRSLESLDLSRNMLSGEIPSSLSNLTYLSFLDLSDNNLTGRIPPGSQLDTLYEQHPYMYSGNSGLCGPPLRKNCSSNDASKLDGLGITGHGFDPMSFRFGLDLGFLFGLWVVFCILLFKKSWRLSYLCLVDRIYDKMYACC